MAHNASCESRAESLKASYSKRRGSASGVLMGFSERSKKTALPLSELHVPLWIKIITPHRGRGTYHDSSRASPFREAQSEEKT